MNGEIDVLTLSLAKNYTDESIAGAGALEGKPCQIQSIETITGGNRITFLWEDNDGVEHTDTMDVMNGTDGGKVDSVNGCDGDVVLSLSISEGVVSLTQEEV